MNPTNESIGRAFLEAEASLFVHTTPHGLFKLILERARELDRQAPGEWVMVPREPTQAMLHSAQHVYSESALDIYRAMLAAAPQPPAQEQGEAFEDSDVAFTLKMLDKLTRNGKAELQDDTGTMWGVDQIANQAIAIIRWFYTRAAGAEDARDAGAMMERWQSVWEDCNEIACNTGSDMIHRRAMQVLSYLDDHEPGKLERDATRYRFLRDVADNKDRVPFIAKRDSWCVSAWNGEAADESVDAAIASQAQEGKDHAR